MAKSHPTDRRAWCFVFLTSLSQAVQVLGGKAIPYPCRAENGWIPDPKEVASLITPRTKLLLLGSPGNPTGAVIPLGVMDDLLRLARERDLWVLSDEIYSDINLTPGATVSARCCG